MTHKDIYTKFMIEYDKANVTSSYPSLTEYEVATFLDKAYYALIAQKVTGNNVRRAPFEADTKSISDLQGLVATSSHLTATAPIIPYVSNLKSFNIANDFLYFISGKGCTTLANPGGNTTYMNVRNIKLVTHSIAEKFFQTQVNMPWIKEPVAFIEDNKLNVVYDPISGGMSDVIITFIRKPNKFVKGLEDIENIEGAVSCFDWTGETPDEYEFELNETAAEELINLAITFALENVESQRLNTKLNTRGLEA